MKQGTVTAIINNYDLLSNNEKVEADAGYGLMYIWTIIITDDQNIKRLKTNSLNGFKLNEQASFFGTWDLN